MIRAWRIVQRAVGHAARRPGLTAAAVLAALASSAAVTFIVADSVNDSVRVLDELRTPTARTLLLRASDGATFDTRATRWLAQLDGVDNAVGLSSVRSATNHAVPGAQRTVGYFELTPLAGPDPIELLTGRSPRPDEALVSVGAANALAMSIPEASVINVDDTVLGVVGTFQPRAHGLVSDLLTRSAISETGPPSDGYQLVAITVQQPADMATIVTATRRLFPTLRPTDYTIEFDQRLADVEATVSESNRRRIRSIAVGVVAIGAAIQAIVAAINALTQRREIARRRALGATRSTLFGVLVVETTMLGALGASAGAGLASLALSVRDATVPTELVTSAIVFTTAAAIISAIPGAIFGAYQDPAVTLRVP